MVTLNPAISEKLEVLQTGALAGHYIFNRDVTDADLARRFSKPEKYAHNISYGIYTERNLIDQYYHIRQEAYRELHKDPNFIVPEDKYDLNSVIYMAKQGNNCIGGIRLTISTPENNVELCVEGGGVDLRQTFPKLDFDKISYCEASKLAILPEFRDGYLWDQLHHRSTRYLVNELGIQIGFGQSHALQTRRLRSQFRDLGYEMTIRHDVKTAAAIKFKELGMQFWAIDFTPNKDFTLSLKSEEAVEQKNQAEMA